MPINQFKYQFFSFKSLERNLLYSFCPNIPYSSIMLYNSNLIKKNNDNQQKQIKMKLIN